MPKAKPVSLHPLTFDEAIKALIRVDPALVGLEHKQRKPSTKSAGTTKLKKAK